MVGVGVELAFVLDFACNVVAISLLETLKPLSKVYLVVDLLESYAVLLVLLEISKVKVPVTRQFAEAGLVASLELAVVLVLRLVGNAADSFLLSLAEVAQVGVSEFRMFQAYSVSVACLPLPYVLFPCV